MNQAAKLTAEMIDADSHSRHFRVPERPRADFALRIKAKPIPIEIKRANGRKRTRQWRQQNDQIGRPESADVARALLVALAMSPDLEARLEDEDLFLVAVALELLDACGFSRESTKKTIRRFRQRVVDRKVDMREAQDVRMRAFDEFVECAAARADAEGFR